MGEYLRAKFQISLPTPQNEHLKNPHRLGLNLFLIFLQSCNIFLLHCVLVRYFLLQSPKVLAITVFGLSASASFNKECYLNPQDFMIDYNENKDEDDK